MNSDSVYALEQCSRLCFIVYLGYCLVRTYASPVDCGV